MIYQYLIIKVMISQQNPITPSMLILPININDDKDKPKDTLDLNSDRII